jgi:hypothetical protein
VRRRQREEGKDKFQVGEELNEKRKESVYMYVEGRRD